MGYKEVNQAVEFLIFEVKEGKREEFIKLDNEIWTEFLSKKPGFIRKETVISEAKPNEVYTILYWNTLKEWKSIPIEELIAKDQEFTEKFGKENFKMIGEVHKDHNMGLYKVNEHTK